jgi:hypothetical protein
MASMIAEEMATGLSSGEKPKAAKKAGRAPHGGHVAKKKGKSTKKAGPTKKTSQGAEKAKPSRPGSTKTDKVLDLLKRPGGVTAKDLMKVDGSPIRCAGSSQGPSGKRCALR